MLIQSILLRKGGTTVTMGQSASHFKPNEHGHHVAEVGDKAHLAKFLQVPEGFQLYDEADALAADAEEENLDALEMIPLVMTYRQLFGEYPDVPEDRDDMTLKIMAERQKQADALTADEIEPEPQNTLTTSVPMTGANWGASGHATEANGGESENDGVSTEAEPVPEPVSATAPATASEAAATQSEPAANKAQEDDTTANDGDEVTEELVNEYFEVTGKAPRANLKAVTMRRHIDEAKAAQAAA